MSSEAIFSALYWYFKIIHKKTHYRLPWSATAENGFILPTTFNILRYSFIIIPTYKIMDLNLKALYMFSRHRVLVFLFSVSTLKKKNISVSHWVYYNNHGGGTYNYSQLNSLRVIFLALNEHFYKSITINITSYTIVHKHLKKLSLSVHNSHFHVWTATRVSKWDFFATNDSVTKTTVPRVTTAFQLWTLFSSKQQFPSSQGKPTSLHTIWQFIISVALPGRTTSYKTWTDSVYHWLPEPHGYLSNP